MGVICEEVSTGHAANNPYEHSKMQAEVLVHQREDLRVRIFQPSIVIGHSTTREVASGFGLLRFYAPHAATTPPCRLSLLTMTLCSPSYISSS